MSIRVSFLYVIPSLFPSFGRALEDIVDSIFIRSELGWILVWYLGTPYLDFCPPGFQAILNSDLDLVRLHKQEMDKKNNIRFR